MKSVGFFDHGYQLALVVADSQSYLRKIFSVEYLYDQLSGCVCTVEYTEMREERKDTCGFRQAMTTITESIASVFASTSVMR